MTVGRCLDELAKEFSTYDEYLDLAAQLEKLLHLGECVATRCPSIRCSDTDQNKNWAWCVREYKAAEAAFVEHLQLLLSRWQDVQYNGDRDPEDTTAWTKKLMKRLEEGHEKILKLTDKNGSRRVTDGDEQRSVTSSWRATSSWSIEGERPEPEKVDWEWIEGEHE
jgi:hypothetical protein